MKKHLKILSGGAMRPFMAQLVPQFERAHDTRIDVEFRLTSALQRAIRAGEAFDIAVMPRPELDELIVAGAIAAASTADVARSTVGLAIRAGAPRPDIGTVAALRRALQQAGSIAYSDGPSGAYVAGLLAKLGITDEMAPKTRLTSKPVAELVASGEAELGMQQIVAILPVKGAELVGPLPAELQNVIVYVYAAGISPPAPRIAFKRTLAAARPMRAIGLEPT